MKLKNLKTLVALGVVLAPLALSTVASADIQTDTIDEKWGKPTLVYGESLTDAQVTAVNDALGIKNIDNVARQVATGDDMAKYLGIDTHPTMLSSVLVQKKDKGTGVVVNIKTPNDITKVTQTQYANAAITAGASDVEIDVAAPSSVTGESALTGVYKALTANGTTVDETRSQVAQNEISTVTDIANANKDEKGFSSENLDNALVEIKQNLANYKKTNGTLAEDSDITAIVKNALDTNGLSGVISDDQINKLVEFAKSYQATSAIDDKQTLKQLGELKDDIASKISDGLKNIGSKENIEKGKNFFSNVWDSLTGFFSGLLGNTTPKD